MAKSIEDAVREDAREKLSDLLTIVGMTDLLDVLGAICLDMAQRIDQGGGKHTREARVWWMMTNRIGDCLQAIEEWEDNE